jgi:predicted nucleic acid-binding protein
MKQLLVDTDVVIDYLRGLDSARSFFKSLKGQTALYLSVITLAEIYSGKETKDPFKARKIEEFLLNFEIALVTPKIAKITGQLRRDYSRPFADMLIAATAIEYGFGLATRNIKHFKDLPNLEVAKPY